MTLGIMDLCRRRKSIILLVVVCLVSAVFIIGHTARTLPRFQKQSVDISKSSIDEHLQSPPAPLKKVSLQSDQTTESHLQHNLLGLGTRRTGNRPPPPVELVSNNLKVEDGHEQQLASIEHTERARKIKNLLSMIPNTATGYGEILELVKTDDMNDAESEEIIDILQEAVNRLKKDVKTPPKIVKTPPKEDLPLSRDVRTKRLYLDSSMPLGPALKLEHNKQQTAIVNAIKHAWKGYKTFAWGKDELLPLSRRGSSSPFGMGMTLVDCLDTLWLVGLQEEFDEARDWVAESLSIRGNTKTVSLFETNIRVLGGLLSAYHLSQDQMFLERASELAVRLLPAFNTSSGVPSPGVNLQRGIDTAPHRRIRSLTVAEAGTLQLEFRDISRATGDPVYKKACDRDMDILLGQAKEGLVPMMVNPNTGRFQMGSYSVGGGIDSYYEYLLKQWLQSGKTEDKFLNTYLGSVKEITDHLVGYTSHSKLPFVGKSGTRYSHPAPIMDHLSCFYPGMLALGLLNKLHPEQTTLAANLTHTCYYAYEAMPTGVAPEIFHFYTNEGSDDDIVRRGVSSVDFSNILRPETVESLFILYRLTKDNKYRDWGWKIFQAFEKNAKVEGGGYGGLKSVLNKDPSRNIQNKMESFFIAETLKYLFLLFTDDDNVLSLDEWVFNTEAHPLPIWRVPE